MSEINTAPSDDASNSSAKDPWNLLDETWLALPAEATETAKILIWVRSFEGDTTTQTHEFVQSLVPQVAGAIFGLEQRVIELEKEIKRMKG